MISSKAVYDGCDWILYGGFHPLEVAKKIVRSEIEVEVTKERGLDRC